MESTAQAAGVEAAGPLEVVAAMGAQASLSSLAGRIDAWQIDSYSMTGPASSC